jgi:hypothetical protein
MARRGDGIYLRGRIRWLQRAAVAVTTVAVLMGCSRSEEDIGTRLHRECISIANAFMGVDGGSDFTGANSRGQSKKALLIQHCILNRGGARISESTE